VSIKEFIYAFHQVLFRTSLSFIHPVVIHWLRTSASYLNFQYPVFSLRLSSSCLHLLPRLSVTCILPSTFPSITCFRRQFLRKNVTIPASLPPFRCLYCTTFSSSLTLCNTFISHTIGATDLPHPTPASNFKIFQVFLIYFPKNPTFTTIKSCTLNIALYLFLSFPVQIKWNNLGR